MARLQVRLLGGFEARLDSGQELALKGRKTQALLAYLAVAPGLARSRDSLTGLLWSDRAEEQARGSLRQALAELRRALEAMAPSPLDAGRETVTLDAQAVDSDVADLERLIAEGGPDSLSQAAELYRGEMLEGFGAADPAFEDWLAVERSRLGELALAAMGDLLDHLTAASETERAVALARRLLAFDARADAPGADAALRRAGRPRLGAQAVPGLPRGLGPRARCRAGGGDRGAPRGASGRRPGANAGARKLG
jgi:DNA-binding SARP family transcriptional activator